MLKSDLLQRGLARRPRASSCPGTDMTPRTVKQIPNPTHWLLRPGWPGCQWERLPKAAGCWAPRLSSRHHSSARTTRQPTHMFTQERKSVLRGLPRPGGRRRRSSWRPWCSSRQAVLLRTSVCQLVPTAARPSLLSHGSIDRVAPALLVLPQCRSAGKVDPDPKICGWTQLPTLRH